MAATHTYIDVSMSHVSEETSDWLSNQSASEPTRRIITVGEYHEGFFVSVPPDTQLELPEDLAALFVLARARGAKLIRLDADAPVVGGMRTYEW